MSRYVDGFVIVIPKRNVAKYKKMAAAAGKVWMSYGALEYVEAVGDDLNVKMCNTFPNLTRKKPNETVFFSYVVYKSRKHRDSVNKKIMSDPAMSEMCDPNDLPFEMKKLYYGGFKPLVDLSAKKKKRGRK